MAFPFLFATLTRAQESRFLFDANGNLLVQTAAGTGRPQILAPPQNQVVEPGESASFSVMVADTRDLTYQWQFNGAHIAGATNDALLLTNVASSNEGIYSVVVANPGGEVASTPAALILDRDRDGLPDSWELTHLGALDQTATGDFDGDGASNLREFVDGTDPADNTSIRFHLTVLSDGGSVTVSPSRFTFTNGETVTVSATAFAPFTFRGWTGDVTGSNNPRVVTMTHDTTVFAHQSFYDIAWSSSASGDWEVATNWSPSFVPGPNDNVFITNIVQVTLNSTAECASLTLGTEGISPNLAGGGTLTLQKDSFWNGGAMTGDGLTIVSPGAKLTVSNPFGVTLGPRTLENGGILLWNDGVINLATGIVTNRSGALFVAQNNGSFNVLGALNRVDNAGTFRKTSSGSTTWSGSVPFNNYNSVEIQAGTLSLAGGGLNNGTMDFSPGTTFQLSGGVFTSSANSRITGAAEFQLTGAQATLNGLVNLSGNHTFTVGSITLNGAYICTSKLLMIGPFATAIFSGAAPVTPSVLTVDGGNLSGSGVVAAVQRMTWTEGTMSGSGVTIVPAGSTLVLSNSIPLTLSRTLENRGTIVWTGAAINMAAGVLTNCPGALFHLQNNSAFNLFGAPNRLDNAGIFRKTSSGTTLLAAGIPFNNYALVDLRSGILSANGGYHSSTGALLNFGLAGTIAGNGYAQLQVVDALALNGTLSVDFVGGFLPALNDSFTVVTAGTRTGSFNNFAYPSDRLTMQLNETANSVVLRVTDVFNGIPQPVFLPPEISGTNLQLTWTSVSNASYRLEFNPDLTSPDWNALPGDVIAVGNTASRLDALTSSNRFYRVRILP